MRVKSYVNGGNSVSGFTFNGGTLTGALMLAGNPTEVLEAAPKQYVDSVVVNLNGSNITSGIISSSRLPVFGGDLVKPLGSATINLAPSGVTAGDYTMPTVDAKGRVTGSGGAMTADDMPNLSWDKITTGKPTTLSGYGITDALTSAGGTLTGFLTFNGTITGNMQAITRQYIDTTLSTASGIAIGDIIRKPFTTTPTGFLKCNGGLVDKTTYNSLYSIVGNRFSRDMQAGAGQPWRQQYIINDIQDGDITNWSTGTSLPGVTHIGSAIVTKNRVYLIGGNNGTVFINSVYTAPINSDGTLGTWITGTALPGALGCSSAIVTKNRVYLLGGNNGSAYVSTVYTATINSDGTIGTWTAGTSLPEALGYSQAIVTKNRVYILGGGNGSAYVSTVYTATINSDGTIGTWVTGTSLPGILGLSSVIVTKNRVYLLGGNNGSAYVSTVYTATINSDGTIGTWTAGTSLPGILGISQAIVTKNRVYLLGGYNGSSLPIVYNAPINSDGTLGTWSTGTSLPVPLIYTQSIVTKNRVYLLGGYNGSAYISSVYTAVITGGLNDYSEYYKTDDANYTEAGNGKPWQLQYQINQTQSNDITGWTTTTSLPGVLCYSTSIVTKNRVYLLGGNNNTGYVSTVYTAPINTDGTLGTWTTGTSLPIAMGFSSAIVTKDRVYLLGGYNGTASISTVYTAPINSDGTIGTWTTGTSLPAIRHNSQAIITKNRVYLISGSDATNGISTTHTAPINSDGTLGTWTTGTALPPAVYGAQVIVTKNRVYLMGGIQNGSFSAVVYTANINSDGIIGIWTTATSLPADMYGAQVVVTKNKVYLLAGQSSGGSSNLVYTASINADGTLGTWTTGTSLPGIRHWTQAVVTNSRVYLLGGYTSTGVSDVYMAPLSGGLNDYSDYYLEDTTNYLMPGSGRPWQQQFQINTTQTADITGWTTGTALPVTLTSTQVIVTKNRVYLLGGYNGTSWSSTVYTAPINGDGTLGAWITGTSLPSNLGWSQAIVTKNRVYLLGGRISTYLSIVYTATINSDGTLGTWTIDNPLPGALGISQAIVTKNRVYLLGGFNGANTTVSTVYTAPINSDGTLGTWATGTSLPGVFSHSQAIVTKNRVYLCGGYNGSAHIQTVYTAPVNTDGTLGTWTTGTSIPAGLSSSQAIVTKNRVYLLGGWTNNNTDTSVVYTAPINDDGTLGTWTTGTSLPNALYFSQAIVTNNKVYLLGGSIIGNAYTSTVYTATINEGLNDYSPYYDGTIVPAEYIDTLLPVDTTNMFALPDLTNTDKFDTVSYIKY